MFNTLRQTYTQKYNIYRYVIIIIVEKTNAQNVGNKNEFTDLSIVVQVRVEPDPPLSCCPHVDQHRRLGILGRKEHIKLKTAVGVGCVRGTCYQYLRDKRK